MNSEKNKEKVPEWFKNPLRTVGDLKKAIQDIPDDTKLLISDADCGGYDVSDHNFGFVILEDGVLSIRHREEDLANLWYQGIISEEKYREFINS